MLKTVLICGGQGEGSASKFEDMAAGPGAICYHGMQFRGKIAAKDESAGRDKNDAGSNDSAGNTTVREESRNSRINRAQSKGIERRGTGKTNGFETGNVNHGGLTPTNLIGNSSDDSNLTSGRGRRERGRNNGKSRQGRCRYCRNSTKNDWHDCPLRLSHLQNDDPQHAKAAQVRGTVGGNNVPLAWCTQEDIAFPTPPGNRAAVFVDTADSHHMVPAKSRLDQYLRLRRTCKNDISASLVQHRRVHSNFVHRMTEVSCYRSSKKC